FPTRRSSDLLIKLHLFSEDLQALEEKEEKLTAIDSEIAELVEATKVEESEEADALGDALNKNETNFTLTAVRVKFVSFLFKASPKASASSLSSTFVASTSSAISLSIAVSFSSFSSRA